MTDKIFPKKPKLGKKCNNCGYCCANEICQFGKALLLPTTKPPCPFLFQLENVEKGSIKFVCHLVILEKILGQIISGEKPIAKMLGIGRGCCSDG